MIGLRGYGYLYGMIEIIEPEYFVDFPLPAVMPLGISNYSPYQTMAFKYRGKGRYNFPVDYKGHGFKSVSHQGRRVTENYSH